MKLLPDECFDLHPGTRLEKTREYLGSLSGNARRRLDKTIREKLTFPHRAYAIPAWGLMVLSGPGGEKGDPSEKDCDWTPGLGKTSRHFAEFPTYINGQPARYAWQRMRSVIRQVVLPGVNRHDRFACWGWINLTEDHAPRDAERRTTERMWEEGENILWKVVEACRPALIIAPPSQSKARCYARIQNRLRDVGGLQNPRVTRYPGNKQGHLWEFHWWKTPWGYCRVGKMHNHPYIWGCKVTKILTEEARHIAAKK